MNSNGRPEAAAAVEAHTPDGSDVGGREFLSRTDLRAMGLPRRAVDAVFGRLPVVAFPGYSRPLIRRADFEAFIADCTYDGSRVRP
jgi:hypothetical protein